MCYFSKVSHENLDAFLVRTENLQHFDGGFVIDENYSGYSP